MEAALFQQGYTVLTKLQTLTEVSESIPSITNFARKDRSNKT